MKDRLAFGFLRLFFVVLVGLAGSLHPYDAKAQSMSVTPVTIVIPPGEMASSLTITNQGDRILSFQLRAFIWTQSGTGESQLTPAGDLIASPPLGSIPPGGRQIARLVLHRPAQGKEASSPYSARRNSPARSTWNGEHSNPHVDSHLCRTPHTCLSEFAVVCGKRWRPGISGWRQQRRPSYPGSKHQPDYGTRREVEGRWARSAIHSPRRRPPLAHQPPCGLASTRVKPASGCPAQWRRYHRQRRARECRAVNDK